MEWLKSQFEWLLIQEPSSLLLASLGWPAVFLCMLLSVSGVYLQKPRFLIIAAILILPFCLYLLGANNWIGTIPPFIPLFLVICWYTVRRKLLIISWSILVLSFSIFSYLAYVIASH